MSHFANHALEPAWAFFVPEGRKRIASGFNPWLDRRHGLKTGGAQPEAIIVHP